MSLFRKKQGPFKSYLEQLQEYALKLYADVNPAELEIKVNGHIIKPVHNQNVLNNVAAEIRAIKEPPGSKENNIHWTNFYVFHSLKEGAAQQNVPFLYSPITLFHLIDLKDYHLVIIAAGKIFNFKFN
jgi:hypothetical protein